MPSETGTMPEQATGPIVAAISREIVGLYARLLGQGPARARTRIDEDHVVCVLEDVFTRAERLLIDAGRGEQVVEMRRCLQEEIAPQLVQLVEEQTGRTVRVCLGQVDADADLALEFSSLEPSSAAPGA